MVEKTITSNSGREIVLRIETRDRYTAWYNGEFVGGIDFDDVDMERGLEFHIDRMKLKDGFKRDGIGTAIVEWAKEMEGAVYCNLQERGSGWDSGENWLTGDGPAFIRRCKAMGLVEKSP